MGQINKMPNVQLYLESTMTPETVAEFGADHVVVATGSQWRRDGTARHHSKAIPIHSAMLVLTPDDILNGMRPKGRDVVLYDDDHYYMGGVIAELLCKEGFNVTLVTPSYLVSSFTKASLEQPRIQTRMLELGVHIHANLALQTVEGAHVTLACVFTGKLQELETHAVVMVTAKDADEKLFHAIAASNITRIGDCYSPGTIAAAVHSGRKLAEGFGEAECDFLDMPYRREVTELSR
jgi:dimethylamine/trimethylamine dehydrogenase